MQDSRQPTRSGWTIPSRAVAGFARSQGSEEVNDALKMIRLRRPAVWILLLVGLLLGVVAGAAGAYLALKQSGSDGEEGFLAHGQVSVAIFGVDVDTPQSRRCRAKSDQAATTIRQGIPVTISLNGTAVGGGDLSVGHLTREPAAPGKSWFAPGVLPIHVYGARDGEERGQIYGRYRHSEGTVFDG